MKNKKPLITIITSSWNRYEYLKILAKSLRKQKFKNFEWIIANDGSTDQTDKFVKKFSKKVNFKITYINSSLRVGKTKLTNLMLKKISGKYTIECDSDDYFLPNSLQNLLKITNQKTNKRIKNFAGVIAQSVSTKGKSQTFKKKIPKQNMIVKWQNLNKIIDGDATTFALSKNLKNKKYLEVDFLITESSLLNKVFKNKVFILSTEIVKIMNRSAENSVSFGKKLQYTRGSAYCIAAEETTENFKKKKIILRLITVIKYWRYVLHADISFLKAIQMLSPIKNNYFYTFLFPLSLLLYLRDLFLNKVEKTHIEFNKNIKISIIKTVVFNN